MATKKKLLQAAAGTAAASGGAGGLNVEDVFSTYLYEGNGSSQVIENGINLGQSYGSGSISTRAEAASAVVVNGDADFGYGTGDFTIELWVWINKHKDFAEIWDQRTATQDASTASPIIYSSDSGAVFYYHSNGNKISSNNGALSEGVWNHIALTRYGGTTKLFVDGTQVGNAISDSTNYATPASDWSIGGSFAQSLYNVDGYVSNARVVKGTAVYTGNFTVPTGELSNITNTVLLTAQGADPLVDNSSSSHTITANAGAKASTFGPFDAADAGEGGLVWIKNRDDVGSNHVLFDTERPLVSGDIAKIYSNLTNGQDANTDDFEAFNSNGFTLNGTYNVNSSSYDYASWTFRKAPKFFDVVTYTGDGTDNRVINHNLGTNIGTIIIKCTSHTSNWVTWHRTFTQSGNSSQFIYLNSTGAVASDTNIFNGFSTTSFTVGGNGGGASDFNTNVNTNGRTYVAYLFAHNDGDGDFGPDGDADIIKCGSYSGTGAAGNFVDLGFEPQWVLIKRTDSAQQWPMVDIMRGMTADGSIQQLRAQSSGAESTVGGKASPNATGFTLNDSDAEWNASGGTYIYIAIRRGPMAVPESATDVFALDGTYSASSPQYYSGWPVDFWMRRYDKTSGTDYVAAMDRLRGNGQQYLNTTSTAAESFFSTIGVGQMDGADINGTSNSMAWMWRRAPNFFDVVAYTGNGTAGRTVSHNLGVAPEMIWVKGRDVVDGWHVYHSAITADNYLLLNASNSSTDSATVWNDTAPTDSVFTLGSNGGVNGSGSNYIAYLFATLDGVSKVGSFTHTAGTDTTVDCGFTGGARFVIIKRSSASGQWNVFDTERGLVAGNDAWLNINTTDAENTTYDFIDPSSSGFTVDGSGILSSATYIFYAIA